MSTDIFPWGVDWDLDQLFDFFPSDDTHTAKAQDGLPGISIKSETPVDTPINLEALCSSPAEGSLGSGWMEEDYDFSYNLSLDDAKPFSTTLLPTPMAVSSSLGQVGEIKELESLHPEFADEFLHTLHSENPLKLETPSASSPVTTSQDLPPEILVTPEIVLDTDATDTDTTSALQVLESGNVEFLQCPLTSDDVESLLSSASSLDTSPAPPPLSPSSSSPDSPTTSTTTVDTSALSPASSNHSWSFSSSDLYKVVENTDQSRSTPYSRPPKSSKSSSKSKGRKQTASISPTPSELELEGMSKKDRKKLQNKNAAIRYRMKKKKESEVKKSEVEELEEINQSLHEKCDELQREVKCMKDLINDIRKARGQAPMTF